MLSERYAKMLVSMFKASGTSLQVFFLTLLFAIPFAMVVAMGRMSKNRLLSGITNIFLLIIRGTPLMLQLLVVYFGPGLFIRWLSDMGYDVAFRWNRFAAAIIALSINYAAYFAEIYRGGIESIPKGQYEACKVLGYTRAQTFFTVILPQVIKRIVPAMGNEVITLVKDTALVSVIGALFSFWPLFIAGAFYFFMNWIVSVVFRQLEKKLSYYN